MKVKLTVGFFSPTDNSLLNRVAACWTANNSTSKVTYSHVELRFSNGDVTSITRDPGVVHYETNRLLSNSGYRAFFEITVDSQMEEIAQDYAKKCDKKSVPFNGLAMCWNFVPFLRSCHVIRAQNSAYFCSEYLTVLLQKAGQCMELDSALTSPNDLYAALRSNVNADQTLNKTLYRHRNVKLLSD